METKELIDLCGRCSHCGGEPRQDTIEQGGNVFYVVTCTVCEASGPIRDTDVAARLGWKRRPVGTVSCGTCAHGSFFGDLEASGHCKLAEHLHSGKRFTISVNRTDVHECAAWARKHVNGR